MPCVLRYSNGTDDSLRPTIDNWVSAMAKLQQTANPSGDTKTGGLGEPKFVCIIQSSLPIHTARNDR
jgi:hypothetical protein